MLHSFFPRVALVIICIPLLSSCMKDMEIHGKCGYCMAATVGVCVGAPITLACLPVTIPVVYATDSHRGDAMLIVYYYPSMPFTTGAYYLGTTLAYPAYLCTLPFSESRFDSMPDDEKVQRLVGGMPYISKTDYEVLLMASHRKFAQSYIMAKSSAPHLFGATAYGRKSYIIDSRISDEWKAWLDAGAPAGGVAEKRFLVSYLIYKQKSLGDFRALRMVCEETGATPDDIEEFCKGHKELTGTYAKLQFWVEQHGGVNAIIKNREL
jgi:hypothetical protein